MIYNVIFSHNPDKHYDWSMNKEKGYVEAKYMNQSIKVESSMLDSFTVDKQKEVGHFQNSLVHYYKIPNCRYVSNNKTMNPILLGTNRDEDETDNIIIYLVIDSEFRLVSYNLENNIKILRYFNVAPQKKFRAYGCAIVCNKKDILDAKNNRLITLKMFDKKANIAGCYEVNLNPDKMEIDVDYIKITGSDDANIRKIMANQKHPIGFRIHTLQKSQLTCTFIYPKSKYEMIDSVTNRIKNRIMIEIDDDKINDASVIASEIKKNNLLEKHIRAITTVDILIPKDVIFENKIIYVFKYNEETHMLEQVK